MKKKRLILCVILAFATIHGFGQVTLEECLTKAEENYPLIKKYDLLSQTQDLSLSEVNKQWLPTVGLYAQGTLQNAVPEFPSALTDLMAQFGREMKGLDKFQYKVGLELTQPIWDGGATAAKRQVLRTTERENEATLTSGLYAVRERVMSLFFGALLTQEQIKQQEASIELLQANLQKIESLIREGAAMRSDADNVEAQILSSEQRLAEARGSLESYRKVLSLYTGEDIEHKYLLKPRKTMPAELTSNRPELAVYAAQISRNNAQKAEIKSTLMPKISAFMQSFYGYPGFNNFEAMMNRNLSFNILGGIRLNWTLNPLYTRKSSLKKIDIANENVQADRETFLFNSELQSSAQTIEIKNMEEVISKDEEIIRLRAAVRRAAEAQLDNGVIDTVALLSKINDENQARLNAEFHEIKLLQSIYQLKNTLNQ